MVPKSVQAEHMRQNLFLKRLPDALWDEVDGLSKNRSSGAVRFLDPSRHLGFDIFDEENDQPVENSAPWDQTRD